MITLQIEQRIEQYRREQPGIFSWELRDRLLRENVCSRENLPSLSSISRLIKHKMMVFASSKKQEYKTNEGNSAIINTNSSYSNNESLNPQVEEQIEFRRAYDQGKGFLITCNCQYCKGKLTLLVDFANSYVNRSC